MKLSDFGRDFLLLTLRIGKHKPGYVDFYIGPEDLHQLVSNEELLSPKKLLRDCKDLQKTLYFQGYDKSRENYLASYIRAIRTSVEILNDIKTSIEDQFIKFYDVPLQVADETELAKNVELIKEAYGVSGNLENYMNNLRRQRTILGPQVLNLFKKAIKIVKSETKEIFLDLLPQDEAISINLVKNDTIENIKWAYYNWYKGNYCSQIDVNPDFNLYWTSFLSSAAHEGYPGHHTEFCIKEKRLYGELNQFEHSILLLNSPKLILSEGIAELAINMLFSYRDQAEVGLKEFCPNPKIEDSLDLLELQNKIKEKWHLFSYNLAYHALIDRWIENKLTKYARNHEIFSEKTIRNQIKMVSDPVHSTTIFSYHLGSKLIINKYSEFPTIKKFKNLLTKPILPSELV